VCKSVKQFSTAKERRQPGCHAQTPADERTTRDSGRVTYGALAALDGRKPLKDVVPGWEGRNAWHSLHLRTACQYQCIECTMDLSLWHGWAMDVSWMWHSMWHSMCHWLCHYGRVSECPEDACAYHQLLQFRRQSTAQAATGASATPGQSTLRAYAPLADTWVRHGLYARSFMPRTCWLPALQFTQLLIGSECWCPDAA
jgi:hypothetical protein